MKQFNNDEKYTNQYGVYKTKLGSFKTFEEFENAELQVSFKALKNNSTFFNHLNPFDEEILSFIHKKIFSDVFEWAGEYRIVDISKGDTYFAPASSLYQVSKNLLSNKPQNFEEIIKMYLDINFMHPFRDGNGRVGRVWLNLMLSTVLGLQVDFKKISRDEYLKVMEEDNLKVAINLFAKALINNKNIDILSFWEANAYQSFAYEGYDLSLFKE